jgi:glycosyltransferase involved in cell wall biosynthesis
MSTQKPSTVDFRKIVPNPKDLIVVHNGQVRKGRGCENLAAAFKYLPASSLVFMGNGPLLQTILDRAELEGYRDRIHALDPVPPNQVIAATATADLGATMLEDSCLNHRFALPNKLFEYASAGIPVLGSDLPEISSKIKSANIGTTVNPDSTQAISQKLTEIERNRHLIDDWKSNTLSFSETFSWKKASEAFLQYFQ